MIEMAIYGMKNKSLKTLASNSLYSIEDLKKQLKRFTDDEKWISGVINDAQIGKHKTHYYALLPAKSNKSSFKDVTVHFNWRGETLKRALK